MNYKIENNPTFSTLTINLEKGQSFRAESGAMLAMSPTINLEAKATGKGFLGTIKAAVGGESFFGSLFTAETGNGEIILAPGTIGDIIKLEMAGKTIFAHGGSYLAGSPELVLSTRGSFKSMIAGEGLFLQQIAGNGIVFLSSYGAIIERELKNGESYIVDTGHLVAFEETLNYSLKKASKGIFSTLATGEGLVCEFSGHGKIWIQTRNISAFASILSGYLPTK